MYSLFTCLCFFICYDLPLRTLSFGLARQKDESAGCQLLLMLFTISLSILKKNYTIDHSIVSPLSRVFGVSC